MVINGVELNELEINEVGSWPILFRFIILFLIFLAISAIGYFFILQPEIDIFAYNKNNELVFTKQYEEKYYKAYNLKSYIAQMKIVREKFYKYLKQLPTENKLEAWLEDISRQATANALSVESFKPGAESKLGFYGEMPIELNFTGKYEDMASFILNLSNMSRIILLQDFTLKKSGEKKSYTMNFNVKSKVYWYIDEGKKTS